MGTYGEHSSRLRNFEGFKLVTNLKETKEAKCKLKINPSIDSSISESESSLFYDDANKNADPDMTTPEAQSEPS